MKPSLLCCGWETKLLTGTMKVLQKMKNGATWEPHSQTYTQRKLSFKKTQGTQCSLQHAYDHQGHRSEENVHGEMNE